MGKGKIDKQISLIATWVIMLSCFSYPITTVIFLKLGIPTGAANIGLKGLFAILYIALFLLGFYKDRSFINKTTFPLIAFFILYSIRLLYDTVIEDIQMKNDYSHGYLYLYFFVLTFLPCLSLFTSRNYINYKQIIKYSFWFIIAVNFSYLFYFVSEGPGSLILMLSSRAQVAAENTHHGTVINPIVVGVFGAYLVIYNIAQIITIEKEKLYFRVFRIVLCIIGLGNVMLGASRGPVVILILMLLLIILYYFKFQSFKASKIAKFFGIIFTLLLIGGITLVPLLEDVDVFLFKRIAKMEDSIGSNQMEERDYSFAGAIQDFQDSPIIGKHFLGTYDNFYPHNVYLEVLMATGIVGGFFFYWFFFKIYNTHVMIWKSKISKEFLPLFILGLANLMQGMTSGSVSTSPNYWIFLVLLVLLPITVKKKAI